MRNETVAILFAEISNTSGLYRKLGDTVAMEQLGRFLSILSHVVLDNQGNVIKTMRDAVMSTFQNVDAAMAAAAEIQRRLHREFARESTLYRPRVGLHFGSVVCEEGDIFGDSVNVAARLVQLAKPGQILTSKEMVRCASMGTPVATRDLGSFSVKGKRETLPVFELLWQSEAESSLTVSANEGFELPKVHLILAQDSKEVILHEEGHIIQLGREPSNDLIVDDTLASRHHARIEFSQGKFVLEDHSTNGTFVLMDDGQAAYVHREKLGLSGKGQISLGRKFSDPPVLPIEFTSSSA